MAADKAPTILLVDDDPECRRTFSTVLRQAGFGVQEAATGQEGLRLAAQNPAVVVLDVNLPDIDGYEVCRRIKKHPALSTIPVLHFSKALARSEERTRSLEDGADGNLAKPAAAEELLAHVKALFRVGQTERRLWAAANQWKTAFDATSDAVCLLDIEGRVLRCNKAMADLLGLPFTGVVGQPCFPLIQAALPGSLVPDLTRVHQTGRRECLELCAGERWFHVTADPVLDETGEVVGSVQVYADISEFKRADDERIRLLTERAQLADQLNLLLESTGEGVCRIDLHGRCTFINPAGAAMLGYSTAELIGQNFHAAAHHTHRDGRPYEEWECPVTLAMASGEGCRVGTEVMWRRDGTWFPAEYSAHPIRTPGGAACGAVVIFADVTERKRWEQMLAESQKLEAVGRLAAGLAHDFNNLMAVVLGNVAILLKACPEGHADRSVLLAIDHAAWRAADVTSRLLGFSRQSRLSLKPTDLRLVVQEMEVMLRRFLDPRIVLETLAAPDLWPVQADPSQISQVLVNLCLNARDAMPEGGRLTLQTENVILSLRHAQRLSTDARPGEFVRLGVADTGKGIPANVRSRIFEPFFTTKEAGKGTGLGLAVVFGIVRQHQGWVTFTTEEQRGTRFDVYLPRTHAQSGSVPAPGWSKLPDVKGHGEYVLLADDEPYLRDIYQHVLLDAGFQVLLAANGLEAVELYRQYHQLIDLVVLNQAMPHLSGQEALRQLREINPGVRVICMTGDSTRVASHQAVQAVLLKPFHPEQLVAAVRSCLDRAGRR